MDPELVLIGFCTVILGLLMLFGILVEMLKLRELNQKIDSLYRQVLEEMAQWPTS